jgi:tyrosyl-tRNA synthetase
VGEKNMKIDTDSKKIDELLTRGVENIYPNRKFLEEKLKKGDKVTLYLGIDPTGPCLHLGHAISLMKLRQFQELGHQVIMLIGSFTAMIGDPTDKLATRKPLTKEQVLENCKNYKKHAAALLDFTGSNKAELRYNDTWLGKLKFGEIVDLAANFTVQQMLERDMFEKRLNEGKPIGLHEFLYPLMQGYDSVAMDVDGEIGGNDQTFNMLAGRTLMKSVKNKEKFVMTNKLLADPSGIKMGKTTGNMITLIDTPEEKFGKVMSWTDGMILSGFELCTKVSMSEITQIEKRLGKGDNPRDLKLDLAQEIVALYHGEEAGQQSRENFLQMFQKKEIPDDILELSLAGKMLVDVLVESKLVTSKSEARRNIEQKGVKINGEVAIDANQKIVAGDVIQKGKRFFVKIK